MKKILIFSALVIIVLFSFKPIDGITISGKVTDKSGIPLVQASVVIKGSKIGVQTKPDGTFSIIVPNEKAVLIFAYVGYKQKKIKIRNKKTITVSLEKVVADPDQVIIID